MYKSRKSKSPPIVPKIIGPSLKERQIAIDNQRMVKRLLEIKMGGLKNYNKLVQIAKKREEHNKAMVSLKKFELKQN